MASDPQPILPLSKSPFRFAVGSWDGLSSNSWRVFNSGDDVYLACRDNYEEVKWSLHASGRWRMGFTERGFQSTAHLHEPDADRAWFKWDRPEDFAPGLIPALALDFYTSELPLSDELRKPKVWKDVVMIEPAPDGYYVSAQVLIGNRPDIKLRHPGGLPFISFGNFGLPTAGWVYLIFSQEVLDRNRRVSLGSSYRMAVEARPEFASSTQRILVNGRRADGATVVTELNTVRPTPDPLLLLPTGAGTNNPQIGLNPDC